MIVELLVRDLGVIDEAHIVFGPGSTALTGETGAGKTLVVEAIELLVGGRADAAMVRAGAEEAVIEGRFELDGDEVVLRRVVSRQGRSRGYHNGAMCTIATLAELGARLVDLHGQHAHQSLLARAAQRRALDRFGDIDVASLDAARTELRAAIDARAALGGDSRQRAREIDLLRFQLDEIEGAGLDDPDEDAVLEARERLLGDVVADREAATAAVAALGEGGAADALGEARGALADRAPFGELTGRLAAAEAELADIRSTLRALAESLEEDPEALASVRARRRRLHDLMKKYGEDLAAVAAFADELRARLDELEGHDVALAAADRRVTELQETVDRLEQAVGDARRAAAPALARAIEAHLHELAMPRARLEVRVDGPAGDDVELRLAANPGSEPLPLAKVASGGELARTMLAVRLVLTDAPPTLVFDEVDAGIGGETGAVLGRSLAALGTHHQVFVVTHLPQVAACADHQIVVAKDSTATSTRTTIREVDGEDREREIARMLSGQPDSTTAIEHARALLRPATPSV